MVVVVVVVVIQVVIQIVIIIVIQLIGIIFFLLIDDYENKTSLRKKAEQTGESTPIYTLWHGPMNTKQHFQFLPCTISTLLECLLLWTTIAMHDIIIFVVRATCVKSKDQLYPSRDKYILPPGKRIVWVFQWERCG